MTARVTVKVIGGGIHELGNQWYCIDLDFFSDLILHQGESVHLSTISSYYCQPPATLVEPGHTQLVVVGRQQQQAQTSITDAKLIFSGARLFAFEGTPPTAIAQTTNFHYINSMVLCTGTRIVLFQSTCMGWRMSHPRASAWAIYMSNAEGSLVSAKVQLLLATDQSINLG